MTVQIASQFVVILLCVLMICLGGHPVILLSAIAGTLLSGFGNPLNGKDRTQLVVCAFVIAFPVFAQVTADIPSTTEINTAELACMTVSEILICLMVVALLSRPCPEKLPAIFKVLAPLAAIGAFPVVVPEAQGLLFACCCLVVIGIAIFGAARDAAGETPRVPHHDRQFQITILCCVALGMLAASAAWSFTLQSANAVFASWVHNTPVRSVRAYPQGGILGTITPEHKIDPAGTALRVWSLSPPGYLRGRVYDTFEQDRWSSAAQRRVSRWDRKSSFHTIQPLPPAALDAKLTKIADGRPVFPLRDGTPVSDLQQMIVWNDPVRGEHYSALSTLSYSSLPAAASALMTTSCREPA